MMTYIQGGLGQDTERRLEELAPLLTLVSRHSETAATRLREICTTHPDYAVAYWKLLDIWQDFNCQILDRRQNQGAVDPTEAVRLYNDAGWPEAWLLALPADQRQGVVAADPDLQTRELALRLLITSERLWHEHPQATFEVSALAVQVAEAAARRRGLYLRLVGGESVKRFGLAEFEIAIRAYGHYVNALRIRGDFGGVREHVRQLEELTREPIGKNLTEARWLLGTALVDLEDWDLADRCLLDAIREYRRIGRQFEARRARMTRVRLLRASGAEPRRYFQVANRVFRSLSPADRLRQPTLYNGFRTNVPLYLLEAGDAPGALRLWREIPSGLSRILEARRVGLGAVIEFALGRAVEAEARLRTAVEEFEAMDMPHEAALFLLYLGDLLLTTGRRSEAEEELKRALLLFQGCQLKQYVAVACDQLEEALVRDREIVAALRRAIARASGLIQRHDERPDERPI